MVHFSKLAGKDKLYLLFLDQKLTIFGSFPLQLRLPAD